ncbi:MAG: hypothetical protein JWO05_2408 [Gemmatimonadetes bacterium]|nr:hypothetical protein [Gemmatimonadota bacterium]
MTVRQWLVALCAMAMAWGCGSAGDTRGKGASTGSARGLSAAADTLLVIPLNNGTHGMAARIRWMLSPDGHAILAMEDPAGVEAEPVPNGFAFADEARDVTWQEDGAWDVAPSADWKRLAYAKSYLLRANDRDSVLFTEWVGLVGWIPAAVTAQLAPGARTPEWQRALAARLRAHGFTASGMAIVSGVGITHVVMVDSLEAVGSGRPAGDVAVALDGWRVRWTRFGDTVVVGDHPARAMDDAHPQHWLAVPLPADTLVRAWKGDTAQLAPATWIAGPVLDISVPLVMPNGTLVVASTKDGRFQLQVRKRMHPVENESPNEAVLVRLPRAR